MKRKKKGERKPRSWEKDAEEAESVSEKSAAFLALQRDLEERDAVKRSKISAAGSSTDPQPSIGIERSDQKPTRTHVYFDIEACPKTSRVAIRGERVGRIEIELFNDSVPKTCENFRSLCAEKRTALSYERNVFHRIVSGFMAQGGDITREDGTGGMSIYGETFEDESLLGRHDAAGKLSMANSGRHTNNSQFFILFKPTPWLDGKHVVFGQVTSGMHVVRRMEAAGSKQGEPKEHIIIAACGEIQQSSGERKRPHEQSGHDRGYQRDKRRSGSDRTENGHQGYRR